MQDTWRPFAYLRLQNTYCNFWPLLGIQMSLKMTWNLYSSFKVTCEVTYKVTCKVTSQVTCSYLWGNLWSDLSDDLQCDQLPEVTCEVTCNSRWQTRQPGPSNCVAVTYCRVSTGSDLVTPDKKTVMPHLYLRDKQLTLFTGSSSFDYNVSGKTRHSKGISTECQHARQTLVEQQV